MLAAIDDQRYEEVGTSRWERSSWPTSRAVVEWLVALGLFVVSLPVLAMVAVLVKLTSRGPIIYSQTRLGRGGRHYRILKIRTMHHNCERHSGPCWSKPGDPRITRVGRWLRRTHLDELPQLWNVLKGEMSLVGPRPERPELAGPLAEAIPLYEERLLVRPGVTGLAQVQLAADTNLESVRRKLMYDVYYIRHASLGLDLRILLATLGKVLGLSFATSRRLCGVPSAEQVEQVYQDLTDDADQPALALEGVA
ncbi:MAG TPA: sugar transferase [Gemmataceae bacterium]|nr:sugar transferase [Gemmataceae bacterium]